MLATPPTFIATRRLWYLCRHVNEGSSPLLRVDPSGLLVAMVGIDVIARLAVPTALLFLTSGAALYAAVAAGVVSGLAVVRGILAGLHVERTVARGWAELTHAAATCPVEDLTQRSTSATPHPLMDAAFDAINAVALVLPRLIGDVLGLLLIAGYVVVALDPRWLLLGLALVPVLLGVMALARRALRREEAKSFEHISEVARDLDVLLSAAIEVRGQGRAIAMSRRVEHHVLVMAAARRRASVYSALLGLLPLGIVLLGASGSLWRGFLTDEIQSVAQLVVVGGTAAAFVISAMRGVEGWVRSGPKREAYVSFVERADHDVASPREPTTSWRDALRIEGVSVVHPGSDRATPGAVDLSWETGGLAIRGDNGAGKTSLVHVLLGLVLPARGRILLGGAELSRDELAALRERVVFVPQRPYVAHGRSVRWHLQLFAHGEPTDEALRAAIERVELTPTLRRHAGPDGDLLDVPLGELSAGETRRAHLARAFLDDDAELIVLDEPEASLDTASRRRLASWLETLARDRRVILVVHDETVVPESFAQLVCERA